MPELKYFVKYQYKNMKQQQSYKVEVQSLGNVCARPD